VASAPSTSGRATSVGACSRRREARRRPRTAPTRTPTGDSRPGFGDARTRRRAWSPRTTRRHRRARHTAQGLAAPAPPACPVPSSTMSHRLTRHAVTRPSLTYGLREAQGHLSVARMIRALRDAQRDQCGESPVHRTPCRPKSRSHLGTSHYGSMPSCLAQSKKLAPLHGNHIWVAISASTRASAVVWSR
jgi:hypothetical protein